MNAALKSLVLVLLFACNMSVASARPLTDAEKQSLAETVEVFEAAMQEQDFQIVVNAIPPRVKEFIAKQAKISLDDLSTAMVAQMEKVLAQANIESFGIETEEIEYRELSNGEPYALIPTETVMNSDEGKFAIRSKTLAVLEGGSWYLARVNDPRQLSILRQAYPQFTAVEFEGGTMEAVK